MARPQVERSHVIPAVIAFLTGVTVSSPIFGQLEKSLAGYLADVVHRAEYGDDRTAAAVARCELPRLGEALRARRASTSTSRTSSAAARPAGTAALAARPPPAGPTSPRTCAWWRPTTSRLPSRRSHRCAG